MRLTLLLLAFVVVAGTAAAQPAPPATAYGEAVFVVSGRGYGHGVGMSQYGAYGQALAGRSHQQILAHYYLGTTLGRAPTKEVRVLLAEGRQAVTISSSAPFSAIDKAGQVYPVRDGALTLRAPLRLRTKKGRVTAVPPLVVRPGKKTHLALDGREYRGKLELVPQEGFLRVVNHVSLEDYVSGVVPGEVPSSWPSAALEAQAVAARSYALSRLVKGKPWDLYSDVRSQVYSGVAAEEPRTSDAVKATSGEVVLYGGQVASTQYFSSSGGRTASAVDVYGAAVPYLVSRPDPWDKYSPHHRWGPMLLGARTIQSKLGATARVVDASGTPTPSGRLRSLTLHTTEGPETIPSALVRTALGLRSTWISVGVLRLDRPSNGTVVYGSTTRLGGVIRGLTSPSLASSADGTAWARVADLAPDANGVVALDVKPVRTTRYRIQAASSASPAVLVQVAPRVLLAQPVAPGVLTGTVQPKLADASVVVERRTGASWTAVANVKTDLAGGFRVELARPIGAYRARIPATGGFAEGVSPVLQVAP